MASPTEGVVRGVVGGALRRAEEELADEAGDLMRIDHHQASETWNRALALAVHSSPVQQFGISFGIGWLSGYLFKRVSKTAAFLLGCSFLAVQGAATLGIIKVNWRRMTQVVRERFNRVNLGRSYNSSVILNLFRFCQDHIYITSGFTTGAVVAMTF